MLRRLRQAGQIAGALSHHTARSLGTFLLVILLAFGAASWRLSRGPVAIPYLAGRIARAATAALPGMKITIAHVSLAWEGFHRGGAPLDLRLATITVRGPENTTHATISHLRVTLGPLALLRGRIAPIDIIARRTRVSLRAPAIVKPVISALAAAPPPAQPSSRGPLLDLSALRRIRIENATINIGADQNMIALAAAGADLQVTRTADGRVSGNAVAIFTHGATSARLSLTISARHGVGDVRANLAPVNPASLLPNDPYFARLDLPVSASLRWPIGPRHAASGIAATLALGAGRVTLDGSAIPIASGTLAATLHGASLRLTAARIVLAAHDGTAPIVTGTGHLTLTGARPVTLHLAANQAAAPGLLAYWPQHFLPNVRLFVRNRIPHGIASHGALSLGFVLVPAFRITQFHGGFTAHGLTLNWFTGAAPITRLRGTLHIDNPDQLTIRAQSGRLAGATVQGRMRVTGLAQPRQRAAIAAHLTGPVASAIPVLDQPPLFLARKAIAVTGATGNFTAAITAHLPLIKPLKLHDVALTAAVDLSDVDWTPIAGLPIHQGSAHLDVDLHHLAMHGTGLVAQAATRFTARMNLPAGVFRLQAHSSLTRQSAHALGLPAGYWLHGTAPIALAYQTKAGSGALALTMDLTQPSFAIPALGWHKSAGQPAAALLSLAFPANQPLRITGLDVHAPAFAIKASESGTALLIRDLRIGATRAHGSLTPPPRRGLAWQARLQGQQLDLSHAINFAEPIAPPANKPAAIKPTLANASSSQAGVLWHLKARFDQIRLAKAPAPPLTASHIIAFGSGNGLDALTATAATKPGLPPTTTTMRLRRAGAALNVHLTTSHTGTVLAAMGLGHLIDQGQLNLVGRWGAHGLNSRLDLTHFRLPHAPIMGKILQGMTVYGIGDATSGPGLAFTRMIARLRVTHGVLSVTRGRAFSESLGLTATGQVDFAAKTLDLSGTIIPAYALNTLPGKIPLIGKLFRSAKGGGLFAAHYALHGPFANPAISVNPLSALTPGALGRMFNSDAPNPSVNVNKHP